jgi:hypothetical protein
MKRALLFLLVLAAACGNSNTIVGSGQFSAPTALAAVPANDRDLIFVAGTGRDGLRALELCEFIDGNGNVDSTCPEDLQFVPGPIRVFPANVETFDRPLRIAGAWLTSDAGPAAVDGGTRQGVVLVVGADKTVRFVDAENLLSAVNTGQISPPLILPIEGIAADVVADNLVQTGDAVIGDADTLGVSPSVEAFAVSVPDGVVPSAILTEFTVTLDATGAATLPPAGSIKKCTLVNEDGSAFVASRLAIAPRETAPANVPTTLCQADLDAGVLDGGHCFPDTPQPTDDIFVGDAKGDGVVRVKRVSLQAVGAGATPPACAMTRISTKRRLADGTLDPTDRGHSVRALALSPQWYETVGLSTTIPDAGQLEAVDINHPAGELMMMVLEPDPTPTLGLVQDPGGILFADLCTYNPPVITGGDNPHCKDFDGGVIIPLPPYRYDTFSAGVPTPTLIADAGTDPTTGAPLTTTITGPPPQSMEAIAPNGIARDAAFLRAFRPIVVAGQPDFNCPDGACTAIYVGQSDASLASIFLLAAVTSSDGATYYIDVVHRRFVNANFYNLINTSGQSLEPQLLVQPALTPASADPNQPAFIPTPDDPTTNILPFGFRPGVTHNATWFVVWHEVFPGLERVQGFASIAPDSTATTKTFFFDVPSGFADAQADPILHFGVNDAISFFSYTPPDGASADCKAVLATEGSLPLSFEATILSINPDGLHPDRLEIGVPQNFGFDPNGACATFGAVAEFHTAGDQPWMVHQNDTILARIAQNETFVARERRFDYPFDYNLTDTFPRAPEVPVESTDEGLSFVITQDQPDTPGSEFTFTVLNNLQPVLYSDTSVIAGFANGIIPYSSVASPAASFTAVTGSNSIVMAQPSVLSTNVTGIRIFR